jgi:hypothetical protein
VSDEIARLVAAINEHPDLAHGDYTPAVHALVRAGLPALPAVLPLLEADEPYTRLRAQRVLEGVTRAWVKARTPAVPLSRRADREWQKLWQANGSYDWQAAPGGRAASVARWRAWLSTDLQ